MPSNSQILPKWSSFLLTPILIRLILTSFSQSMTAPHWYKIMPVQTSTKTFFQVFWRKKRISLPTPEAFRSPNLSNHFPKKNKNNLLTKLFWNLNVSDKKKTSKHSNRFHTFTIWLKKSFWSVMIIKLTFSSQIKTKSRDKVDFSCLLNFIGVSIPNKVQSSL